VEAEAGDQDWAAVAVVAGIVDVLQAGSDVDASPQMRGVVGFENIFTSIVQGPVAD